MRIKRGIEERSFFLNWGGKTMALTEAEERNKTGNSKKGFVFLRR